MDQDYAKVLLLIDDEYKVRVCRGCRTPCAAVAGWGQGATQQLGAQVGSLRSQASEGFLRAAWWLSALVKTGPTLNSV